MRINAHHAVYVWFSCLWLQCFSQNVAPVIVSSSSNIVVSQGGNVKLLCKAAGQPAPTIEWFHIGANGRKLLLRASGHGASHSSTVGDEVVEIDGAPRTLPTTRSVLELKDIIPQRTGIYECTADNEEKEVANAQIKVTVKFAPDIRMTQCIEQMGKNTFITIECEVDAYPKPEIYWEKNNRLIKDGSQYEIKVKEKVPHVYSTHQSIHFTQSPDDAGVFTCYARNNLGSGHKSAAVGNGMPVDKSRVFPPVLQRDAMPVGDAPRGPEAQLVETEDTLAIVKYAGAGGAGVIGLVALVAVVVTVGRRRGTSSNMELATHQSSSSDIPARRVRSHSIQGSEPSDEPPKKGNKRNKHEKPFNQAQYQAGAQV